MGIFHSTLFSLQTVKTTALAIVVTLVTAKLLRLVLYKRRYKLPPGPWGLPVVGYLPFFGTEPPVKFNNMRKTYGDVISISMGSWPAVIISGYDVIKEALVTKGVDFAGKPAFTTAQVFLEGRSLTFSTFGILWNIHSKIVSKVLHKFKNAPVNPIQEIIRSEVDAIVPEFLAKGDSGFCPTDGINVATYSIMYQLLYGHHDNIRDNADFVDIMMRNKAFQEFSKAGNPVDVMPWLRFFMKGQVKKLLNFFEGFHFIRDKKVAEHEETFDAANLRDIADGLIHAGNTLSAEEIAAGMTKQRVVESLDDFIGAGTDTTRVITLWSLQLLVKYPDFQEKVFSQIQEVVGQGRRPSLADRANLPLVEATMFEAMRFGAAVPFGIPHQTICDTTLQGYDIPEGTVVLVNLYSVYMDEALWGDPQNFRPERFLDSNGQLDKQLVEQVPAFSLGRRRCLGEMLGRMNLFLLLATLLQRLRFYKPPGHPDYDLDAEWRVLHTLKPFTVCASAR